MYNSQTVTTTIRLVVRSAEQKLPLINQNVLINFMS